MKRLILFDLDGVLINSKENMRQSWEVVLDRTNISRPFEDYFALIGRPFKDIMRRLDITSNVEKIEDIYTAASLNLIHQITFFPRVEETLTQLYKQKVKIGIVTSKNAKRVKFILDRLDVNFTVVQCPCIQLRGKPAPDHILMAMARSSEDPSNTLFVGDTITDWQAADRAGIDYIHANWGYGDANEGLYNINCISEVLKFIA